MSTEQSGKQVNVLFRVQAVGTVQIFTISVPRLFDPAMVDQIDEGLRHILSLHDQVVVDLQHVQFISSAMLGRLVMAWMGTTTRGSQLVLCRVNDTIGEILRIAGLYQRFSIYADTDSAVAAVVGA